MARAEGNVDTCWTLTKARPSNRLRCHRYEGQRGLTTVLIRPFLNLFCTNALLLMFSGLCRSHSILHPQCVSKLIDIFDILFQTRIKMYLVPSLNSSTLMMCRLCASIFALSRSGTGTGGGDIEPGIVVVDFLI